MAKFYVTSGEVRVVVQAEDSRTAALWAMHLAMEKGVDLDQLDLSLDQREDLARFDLMVRFERWMSVSEIGFDREEAGRFESIEMMIEWNQLAMAVVRLERLIDGDSLPSDRTE